MVAVTNCGTTYDAVQPSKGLGFVQADFTGVASIIWIVRWNKIGTGTITWQLWNETDGVEISKIDDAAAAGDNKTQTVTITTNLPTGIKQVRVRCKSTVGTDDPVFYGSSIRLEMG